MTFPEQGYTISLRGLESKEQGDTISAEIHAILSELTLECGFDLSRLLGVTVARDYDQALAEFDRGFGTTERLTRTTERGEGVAMTPVACRNGEAWFQIHIDARFGVALLSKEETIYEQGLYTIVHEAAHVHHGAHFYRAFPAALGQPITRTREAAIIAWDEYAASRSSARAKPSELSAHQNSFCEALAFARENSTADLRRYLLNRDHNSLLSSVLPQFGDVLKFAGYLLGHLDGLEAEMSVAAPDAFKLIQGAPSLELLFERTAVEMRSLWDSEETWKSLDVFEPLGMLLLEMIRAHGVDLRPEGYGFRVGLTPSAVPKALGF